MQYKFLQQVARTLPMIRISRSYPRTKGIDNSSSILLKLDFKGAHLLTEDFLGLWNNSRVIVAKTLWEKVDDCWELLASLE